MNNANALTVFSKAISEATEDISIIANEDWVKEIVSKYGIDKLSTLEGFSEVIKTHELKEAGLFNTLYKENHIKKVRVAETSRDYKSLLKTLYLEYNELLIQLTRFLQKFERHLAKERAKAVLGLTYLVITNQTFELKRDFPLFPNRGDAGDWVTLVVGLHYFRNSYDCGEIYEECKEKLAKAYS